MGVLTNSIKESRNFHYLVAGFLDSTLLIFKYVNTYNFSSMSRIVCPRSIRNKTSCLLNLPLSFVPLYIQSSKVSLNRQTKHMTILKLTILSLFCLPHPTLSVCTNLQHTIIRAAVVVYGQQPKLFLWISLAGTSTECAAIIPAFGNYEVIL